MALGALALLGLAGPAQAALTVDIVSAYNLVVDSNVTSPSTYAPSAAMLGAKVCATGTHNNVTINIGDYNATTPANSTPGLYPVLDSSTLGAEFPQRNTGDYFFKHEGGSADTADAIRYVGTLVDECTIQYWLVSYPRCVNKDVSGTWTYENPPCSTASIAGAAKPYDDISLDYDIWAADGTVTTTATRSMTLRNEISASANKIWPNGDNKVPTEYVTAINDSLGWRALDPDGNPSDNPDYRPGYPGETVMKTTGIWYDLGNVGFGFDNDGDLVPDQNAWMQPIGDASGFDSGCFRIVGTYGLVIVKLKGGGEKLITFRDQLYFTNIPENTGAVGLVYYEYIATGSGCSSTFTPYQEVASGFDNEKFSADFGSGIGIQSADVSGALGLDKQVQNAAAAGYADDVQSVDITSGAQLDYKITVGNITADTGISSGGIPIGAPQYGVPVVIQDTIPAGTDYKLGTASGALHTTGNEATACASVSTSTVTVFYSSDDGATWSTTAPVDQTAANAVTDLQWWISTTMADGSKTSIPSGCEATAQFSVTVPTAYSQPVVPNTGGVSMGDTPPMIEDTANAFITGPNSIKVTVFKDDGYDSTVDGTDDGTTATLGNGAQEEPASAPGDGVLDEAGINNVTVYLYYDFDGDGKTVHANDVLLKTVVTSGAALLAGEYTFGSLPDGNYVVIVDNYDPDLPVGYTNSTPTTQSVDLDSGSASGAAVDEEVFFGFSPALLLDKRLISATPVYEGDEVTFRIDVSNALGGSGTAGTTACTYYIWPDSATFTSAWTDIDNIKGRPDGLDAVVAFGTNADTAILDGYSLADLGGTIQTIGYKIFLVETVDLDADSGGKGYDELIVMLYDDLNSIYVESDTYYGDGTTLPIGGQANFGDNAPNEFVLEGTFAVDPSAWTYAQLANYQLHLESVKGDAPNGEIAVDAAAIVITTDQQCGGDGSTLNPVPLIDSFDNTLLEFVSSDPPISSLTVQGTQTVLEWDNLGPLFAGQTKYVDVTYKAINSGTTTNSAASYNATYSDGKPANDAAGSDNVTISATGSISGVVWDDADADGWQGTTGYETGEAGFPGMTVTLYACTDGGVLVYPAGNTGKPCINNANGDAWTPVGSPQLTDSSGSYLFTGLRPGYYYVETNGASFSGVVQTADVNVQPGVCAGAACDHRSNNPASNLAAANFDTIVTDNDIQNINFGYDISPALYGLVWEDADGDGQQDAGESVLTGVTVRLYESTCTTEQGSFSPQTTNSSGYYFFGNLAPSTEYCIKVTTNTGDMSTGTWTQTGENDGEAIDNKITDTAVAAEILGPHNFGFRQTGASDISGYLFYDLDEDYTPATSGNDEAIPYVTVRLYKDTDGDGLLDYGEPLVEEVQSGASGYYEFLNYPNGNYVVQVVTSDGDFPLGQVIQTVDPDSGAALCSDCDAYAPVILNSADVSTVHFGYLPDGTNSIQGNVFRDANNNSLYDGGEKGLTPITVTLSADLDGDGDYQQIASVDSASDGSYSFSNLPDGDYRVVVDHADPQLPKDATNQPVTPTTGTQYDISLSSSPEVLIGGVSGTVWDDGGFGVAGDSAFGGAGDVGVPAVKVELRTADGATVLATTYTDANGNYDFAGVAPGSYLVAKTNPATGGADVLDYDTSISCGGNGCSAIDVTVTADVVSAGRDFLIDGVANYNITGSVFEDDNDGVLEPAQDFAIGGLPVYLYASSDPNNLGVPVAVTYTKADGSYEFKDLPAGQYLVQQTPPSGATAVTNSHRDVPANSWTYKSLAPANITISDVTDLNFLNNNIGVSIISGTVRIDANGDGAADTSDAALTGTGNAVTVKLYSDPNGDGDPSDGIEIDSVQTNTFNGAYRFTKLADGDYVVVRDTAPTGYYATNDIDGATDNTWSEVAVTLSGGDSAGNDYWIANTNLRSISGVVYSDTSRVATNGLALDGADTGLAGVTVQLFADLNGDGIPDGAPVATQSTGAGGTYSFGNATTGQYLPAGQYVVVMTTPEGKSAIVDVQGDRLSPDVTRIPVTLPTDSDVTGRNFLVGETLVNISGYVYEDNGSAAVGNGNDTFDFVDPNPDKGIPGVKIGLFPDADGNGVADTTAPVAVTYTGIGGAYSFSNVPAGKYVIVEYDPPGAESQRSVGTNTYGTGYNGLSGDPWNNVIKLDTYTAALTSYAENNFLDDDSALYFIDGAVYLDTSANGVVDGSEGKYGTSVKIQLYTDPNGDGDPSDGQMIGEDDTIGGDYSFTGLFNGNYVVVMPPLADYTATNDEDNNSKNSWSQVAVPINGGNVNSQDFLIAANATLGSIAGTVRLDDGNGTIESSDAGIGGVQVALYPAKATDDKKPSGSPIATTFTDASGNYSFTGLPAGNYVVVESDLEGYYSVNDVDGSSLTTNNLNQVAVPLASGSMTATGQDFLDITTLDFGFNGLAVIGDTVYWDVNENGTQDGSEPGIAGVEVYLHTFTDTNGNRRYDPGEPISASPVATTPTANGLAVDANGDIPALGTYLFEGLEPGSYVVQLAASNFAAASGPDPEGALFGGTLTADPEADGATFDLFVDANGAPACDSPPSTTNGACDGLSGRTLVGDSYMGADFGYQLPKGAIGDRLWMDADRDGIQDDGEVGIAYVRVELQDGICDPLPTPNDCIIVTTDSEGNYWFTGLDAGTYTVVVVAADLDPGLVATYDKDGGIGSPDSSTSVTITGGSKPNDIDFGYDYAGNHTLSGTICLDDGATAGVCETGESALPGERVYLYLWDDADNDGTVGTGETTPVGSVTTDGYGNYEFGSVPSVNGGTIDGYVLASSPARDLLDLTTATGSLDPAASPTLTLDSKSVVESNNAEGSTTGAYFALKFATPSGDTVYTNLDFAYTLTADIDFGDLPDVYGTLLGSDGARHVIPASGAIYLGATVDADTNGAPSAAAEGDTDDGVNLNSYSSWTVGVNGGSAVLDVAGGGYLMAWIDFNHDGDFSDAGERIIEQVVSAGSNQTINFDIANDVILQGDTYARFRLFEAMPEVSSLAFKGSYDNGEVEDYLIPFAKENSAIGDRVWLDTDGDGVQDIGEPGIGGVTISLINGSGGDLSIGGITYGAGSVIATAITDANGEYLFAGLPAATYQVDVTDLGIDGKTGSGDERLTDLSLAPGSNDQLPVVLGDDQLYEDADFGYVPDSGFSAIGGVVWHDANDDGTLENAEIGIGTVTLTLIDVGPDGIYGTTDDATEKTTTAYTDGSYLFRDVPQGTYVVVVDDTNDADASKPLFNLTPTNGPGSDSEGGYISDPISVVPGFSDYGNNFGFYGASAPGYTLSDRVWYDTDGDGVYEPNGNDGVSGTWDDEHPLAGVSIDLYADSDGDGSAMRHVLNGLIDLNGDGFVNSSDTGSLNGVAIVDGKVDLNGDGGFANGFFFGYPVVSGQLDLDGGDDNGVLVYEKVIATVLTRADGTFEFSGLFDGKDYVVGVGDVDGVLTNLSPTTTRAMDEEYGEPINSADVDYTSTPSFGYNERASIGGVVWNDASGEGLSDLGESGIGGVTVELYDQYGATLLGTAITEPDGSYSFTNLGKGSYVVKVKGDGTNPATAPSAYPDQTGDPDQTGTCSVCDSSSSVMLSGSGGISNVDFGYKNNSLADISGTVFEDTDVNGVYDSGAGAGETGIPLVTLELLTHGLIDGKVDLDFDGYITANDDGFYGGYAVTDGVLDASAINSTINGMKVIDIGSGVVRIDVNGDTNGDNNDDKAAKLLATDESDNNNGDYSFPDLPDGYYAVRVTDVDKILDGYTLTSGLDAIKPVLIGDGNASNGNTGTDVTDIDFGYIRNTASSSISGTTWLDANGNGVQGSAEAILSGTVVTLIEAGNDGVLGSGDEVTVATTTTDAKGNYSFLDLEAGKYQVQVSSGVPANLTQSGDPDEAGPCVTCDDNGTVNLGENEDVTDVDFGYKPAADIAVLGDRVWYDADGDGLQDPGESGIGGVTVNIYNKADGSLATSVNTDADGSWLATITEDPTAGEYMVKVDLSTLPGGVIPTPTNMDGGDTYIVSVKAGDVKTNLDFGYDGGVSGSIGDEVFIDVDKDGIWDAGEGLSGVSLLLSSIEIIDGKVDVNGDGVITTLDNGTNIYGGYTVTEGILAGSAVGSKINGITVLSDGAGGGLLDVNADGSIQITDDQAAMVLNRTTTDANGKYIFSGLPAGDYRVAVRGGLPGGLTQTVGINPTTVITLASGSMDHTTADFGYQPGTGTAVIGDRVWSDANGNGTQDDGEVGIGGVTLRLCNDTSCGTIFDTATTSEDGSYLFTNVLPGTYAVVVTDTNNVLTGYSQKGDPDESGVCGACDWKDLDVVVIGGGMSLTSDFGYQGSGATATGSIGGRTYDDANGDKDDEAGVDAKIANVTLDLVTTGIINGYVDINGDGVITVADNGSYGGYTITAGVLDGSAVGNTVNGMTVRSGGGGGLIDVDGSTAIDGDDDKASVIVATTTTENTTGAYDFTGLVAGDYRVVVTDISNSLAGKTATQVTATPVSGDNITIACGDPCTDFNDADFGFIDSETNLATIGDLVYYDPDGDGATAGYEAGEVGLDDVTLNLIDCVNGTCGDSDDKVIASTTTSDGTTDVDGNGSADPIGTYLFDGLTTGTYRVVVTDINSVLDDLTATQTQGDIVVNCSAAPCTTNPANADTGTDFGYQSLSGANGTLGGTVWHDADSDGYQDDGESGIQGVTIDLWLDNNGDGVIDKGSDNLVRTETTNANGDYRFLALPAGNYIVDQTDTSGVLTGFTIVDIPGSQDTGGLNGTPDQDEDRFSHDDVYAVTLAVDEVDTSVDFGYEASTAVSIGGTVFEDDGDTLGVYNDPASGGDDAYVPGATVELYQVIDGMEYRIGTTTTAIDGGYSFINLPSGGDYVVKVDVGGTLADGMEETYDADASDNGDGCTTCNSQWSVTNLTSDASDVDFGYWNGGLVTTPITLGFFESHSGDAAGEVIFEWETATEVGHVGFYLYGRDRNGEWQRLDDLIVSDPGDSDSVRRYQLRLTDVQGRMFYLSDVDIYGTEALHGPFGLGESFGQRAGPLDRIDWQGIRQEFKAKHKLNIERKRGLMKKRLKKRLERIRERRNLGWSLPEPKGLMERAMVGLLSFFIGTAQAAEMPVAEPGLLQLKVDTAGIHRVTYADLLANGLDLQGIDPDTIKLSSQGAPVPITVEGPNEGAAGAFGPGWFVEFIGEPLDTLYTKTNVYTLDLDEAGGPRIDYRDASPGSQGAPVEYYFDTVDVETDWLYSFSSPNGDPWYAADLLAFSGGVQKEFSIVLNDVYGSAGEALLSVDVWGGTDWPGSADDHHIVVSFNGVEVGEDWFNGIVERGLSFPLPEGAVKEGENKLTLRLPMDIGFDFDRVNLDRYGVTYPRRFVAHDGEQLEFKAKGGLFEVEGFSSDDIRVYRETNGAWARLRGVVTEVKEPGRVQVRFSGSSEVDASYFLVTKTGLSAPDIEPVPEFEDLTKGLASYLIIAHPNFMDSNLERLAEARRQQGFTVKIVDSEAIYAQFGYGVWGADPIRDYIRYAWNNLGTRWVLLVGGDSIDYHDYRGYGGFSFLPSIYGQTDDRIVYFAPMDPLYADVQGDDGVPELAIGRFPVRTASELALIVDKTLRYQSSGDYARTSVFASDVYDEGQLYDFHRDAEVMIEGLPSEWNARARHLSIDELGVSIAKGDLIEAINSGVALASFVGHSSQTQWSLSKGGALFTAVDAQQLTNLEKPTIVSQWGCWNTWYVAPGANTMAHRFMLSGAQGAAAVLGSATLTDANHERELGKRLHRKLFAPGRTIGEAITLAKQEHAGSAPSDADVLAGWTLLGDPALVMEPPLEGEADQVCVWGGPIPETAGEDANLGEEGSDSEAVDSGAEGTDGTTGSETVVDSGAEGTDGTADSETGDSGAEGTGGTAGSEPGGSGADGTGGTTGSEAETDTGAGAPGAQDEGEQDQGQGESAAVEKEDSDGLPSEWELQNGLSTAIDDAASDLDHDGLSALEEYQQGSDGLDNDTDGDGLIDGWDTEPLQMSLNACSGAEVILDHVIYGNGAEVSCRAERIEIGEGFECQAGARVALVANHIGITGSFNGVKTGCKIRLVVPGRATSRSHGHLAEPDLNSGEGQ